jgi:hypothetical protein
MTAVQDDIPTTREPFPTGVVRGGPALVAGRDPVRPNVLRPSRSEVARVIESLDHGVRLAARNDPAVISLAVLFEVARARAVVRSGARDPSRAIDLLRARAIARDLDRARNLVDALDRDRDLARALDRARNLADALDRARDLDRASVLGRALALARGRARGRNLADALDRDRDLDLTSARGRALDRVLALARGAKLADALDRARALDRDLGRDIDRALALARAHAHAHAHTSAPDLLALDLLALDPPLAHAIDLPLARDLLALDLPVARDLARTRDLARDLDRARNDFSSADLRGIDLTNVQLEGLRWSKEGTKWPTEWIDQIERDSVEIKPGLFEIRGGGTSAV